MMEDGNGATEQAPLRRVDTAASGPMSFHLQSTLHGMGETNGAGLLRFKLKAGG